MRADEVLTLDDVRAAARRIEGRVLRTPSIASHALSLATGAAVTLKLESLQVIGSFKERGAANKLALLDADERRRGVVAMSAGNHAQAVARHASLLGIAATIVMPTFTPATKVTRTAAWGAAVTLFGDTLAEAGAFAGTLAAERGLVFVHPYDDPAIIAGQGTLALELLEDAPALDMLVIPVGGGGMLAGCAVAAAALRPGIEIVGVEVQSHAALRALLTGEGGGDGGPTVAEGIAVQQIGAACLPPIRAHVADIVTVPERVIEDAIALLAEGAKLVAEGAGAAGLAAVLADPARFAGRRVGIPVCGGNIDGRILANVLLRSLLRDGRLLRLALDIQDRPGALADIATLIASSGGNIIEVVHQRLFDAPSARSAELELMIEARDRPHAAAIAAALATRYAVRPGHG